MSILDYLKESLQEASNQKFNIPDSIIQNFKIVGGLNNFKNWKAKTLVANSGGKKGVWESPGYVLVSLDSNNIIPVSMADEHQVGYDLLNDYYYKKNLIKPETYISIRGNGTTYLYGHSEDKLTIKAFKKWLAYGGENQPVNSSGRKSYIGDMEDVIDRKGNIDVIEGRLSKPGKKLIDTLEYIAKEYKKFVELEENKRQPNSDDVENLFNYTQRFIEDFVAFNSDWKSLGWDVISRSGVDKFLAQLEKARKDDDWNTLGSIILGHDGIKNIIHNSLRKSENNPKFNNYRQLVEIFGDLNLALQLFNKLGNI